MDVYVVRGEATGAEVLQLRRASGPLAGTWQPVMGHIEAGETALHAALRECAEETGLNAADPEACPEMLALGGVHPFFMAAIDAIVCSPRFVVLVPRGFEPNLNDEHDAHRWVPLADADRAFVWPGQRAAMTELRELLIDPARSETRARLRVAMD